MPGACSTPAGRRPRRSRSLAALGAAFRQLFLRGGLFRGADAWLITITSMFRSFMKYQKLNELHERQRAGGAAPGDGLQLGKMRDANRNR